MVNELKMKNTFRRKETALNFGVKEESFDRVRNCNSMTMMKLYCSVKRIR